MFAFLNRIVSIGLVFLLLALPGCTTPLPPPMPTVTTIAINEAPSALPTPCDTCEIVHVVGVVTEEVQTGAPEGNKLVRVVSAQDGGVWYVDITPEAAITLEDWSAATVSDITPDTRVDVVGPLWSNGYIAAQYVIVLPPDTPVGGEFP